MYSPKENSKIYSSSIVLTFLIVLMFLINAGILCDLFKDKAMPFILMFKKIFKCFSSFVSVLM
jgi:hypothetical protein